MTRAVIVGVTTFFAACSPVRVESPDLVRAMQELGQKLDQTTSKYLVGELDAVREENKRLAAANHDLAAARDKAEAALGVPFELELECDASPASQSEIVASVDGARVGTIECPARSGRVAIRQPSPGKIHVELHVVNDTATYGSFHARLWRGGETVWLVSRSSPMNKTEGCKTPAGDAHRIECVFDAPFELGKTEPGKVRTIDRE